MILFTFENDKYTAIKTESFTSAREQFTCSDIISTCPTSVVRVTCQKKLGRIGREIYFFFQDFFLY